MIRGSIEFVTIDKVGGWLYTEPLSARDRTVLAFLDDRCIGAGKVEIFRQDLADAGLGDGHLGFHFPITVDDPERLAGVVVRLEGSDASLIQAKSRIQAVDQKPAVDAEDIATRLSSLKWMLTRGWLTQAEYDFLKATLQFGVYERTLAVRKSEGIAKEDPAAVAADLLSVWHFNDTGMEKQHVTSAQAFERLLRAHRAQGNKSAMVGLWTEQKANVLVVEGSHIGAVPTEPGQPDDVTGAVSYSIRPEQLLMLDVRCQFAFSGMFPKKGVTVLGAPSAAWSEWGDEEEEAA
ncbi:MULTISPECIES: hypothetical protein [unclassified Chelatococcus]|uniref:hypothetical protein n=1 Tax=unclassified Chelatococcus TaxID=2638111 RepID=UPI001BCCD3D7|nr:MULTISPECIES: hypothetical protein [unclassified Chelatococcus]MBS7696458.1 hypothetical protein [Chelatococcus sp. YT9]MBX3555024.1 hypothetical protein [Chelatococcus sp.]